jgi:Ca2+-binding EF-hand superfamily protein
LLQLFGQVDEDGDRQLTFNEFKKACRDFAQLVTGNQSTKQHFINRGGYSSSNQMSDSDLRYLFNFFDKNGDGHLSYLEVVGALQGEVSPRRKDIIRQVIKKSFFKITIIRLL